MLHFGFWIKPKTVKSYRNRAESGICVPRNTINISAKCAVSIKFSDSVPACLPACLTNSEMRVSILRDGIF